MLSTLQDRPEVASISVLGMTGSAAEADIAQESGIKADAHIQKPPGPAEFIGLVRKVGEFGIMLV